MQQLLGYSTSNTSPVLRELFLIRLPLFIRMLLAAAEVISLGRPATLADRIAEYSSSNTCAVTSPAVPDPTLARVETRMYELVQAVASHQTSSPKDRF